MHIAILLAGHTNKAMPQRFHDYNDMFSDLFASLPIGKNFRFTTLAVVDDVFPAQIDDYDGYLVSGSAYGVYDEAPFIPKLMDFLRQIYAAKKPLAGVCFGHQIMHRPSEALLKSLKMVGPLVVRYMRIKMVKKLN